MHGNDTQRELILKLLEEHPDLGPDAIQQVSEATGIAAADVYGAARFYDLLVRPGARICTGLSCRLKDCDSLKTDLEAQGHQLIEASCSDNATAHRSPSMPRWNSITAGLAEAFFPITPNFL